MRFQKGQLLVEFALILPLFLLFIFCIIYFSMIFLDYMTLNTIARNSAREASVATEEQYANGSFQEIRNHYKTQTLPVDIYDWNPNSDSDFKIYYKPSTDTSSHGNVIAEVHAKLNDDGSWLANIVNGLSDNQNTNKLDLDITCTMYSETDWNNKK